MKKNIFITGGGGFIGSHLVERCVKLGHKVKILSPYNIDNSWGWMDTFDKRVKKNIEVILGDVNDFNLIKKETKKIDIIFHLAALISIPYSYKSPKSYLDTNIIGTYNILEAARENNIELIVNTSTSEVYGSAQYVPIDEKHPLNAQSPYAATKIAADHLSLSYFKSFNLPVTVLRPFNTFGPRQSQRAAIPAIINQIIDGKKKIKLGNLSAARDFTYVADTVEGYIKLIGNKKSIGEVINLGTGNSFTIRETLRLICKILNTKVEVILDQKRLRPKKSEVNQLLSNNKKAQKILKWKPSLSGKKGFENGLKKTIEWSIKNKINIKKIDLYNV
tara:strand:- start:59064 stop:60062 length:999 start_codon:yes stop_codon:yes gene_type:complete